MRRETRLNLIWIAVLLALMAPGAVTIFRKKFKPGEQPMSFREPVRVSAAYMDPGSFPPGFKRIVPRKTADWLGGLLRDRLGVEDGMMLVEQGTERLPPMSANRLVQLVGTSGESPRRGLLILWIDSAAPPGVSDQGGNPLEVRRWDRVALPAGVSLELRDAGYVTPPRHVLAIVVDLPTGTSELLVQAGNVTDRLSLPSPR